MFILDRVTGKPIFGVKSGPCRRTSPAVVFADAAVPVKPPPLTRVEFSKVDMVTADDTSADHVKAMPGLWDKSGGSTMPGRSRRSGSKARRRNRRFNFRAARAV
jgi:hypothetical protein